MLNYANFSNFRYNPFTCVCTPAAVACEIHQVPAVSPYLVQLYESPINCSPTCTCAFIGVTQLVEVPYTQCPACNQYRVMYNAKGNGCIELHSCQANCTICFYYYGLGTLFGKDVLDINANTIYCGCKTFKCGCQVFCNTSPAIITCITGNCSIYASACCLGIYSTVSCYNGIYGYSAKCSGITGEAGCCIGINATAACCIGLNATASVNYGVYGCAACCFGIYGAVGCCYGASGIANGLYGVYGYACCYGVFGIVNGCFGVFGTAVTSYPVAGNGAYYDCTSNRNLKQAKKDISILDCFNAHPNFKVQQWMYKDTNQKGYDYFIAPYAEDVKCTFNLTFEDTGYYQLDGIALGATIELYKCVQKLENKILKLEKKGA